MTEREPADDPAGASAFSCRRFPNPHAALGRAVNLLRGVEPFASYRFGQLSGTLMGQVRRNHYLFTFRDKRIVGYAGWALCEAEMARAWVEGGYVPTYEECLKGDSWIGMTFYADAPGACLYQARQCRLSCPNHKVFFRRDYHGRQRTTEVFNRIRDADRGA